LVLAALAVTACSPSTPGPTPPGGLATLAIDPTPPQTAPPSRPPATPSPADAAIARLVALALDAGTTYEVAITGRSRHSADILPITGTLQVAGADSRLVADFVFPDAGGEAAIELRTIEGEAWLRYEGEAFGESGPVAPEEAPNPFALIEEADDITLVSEEPDADGRYQVAFESMVIHPVFIPAVNLSEESVKESTLTLLIEADGRPVSGSWELTGQGRISRQLQEIVMELDLTFSKLGSDISISQP
jgi:hypothetical protein